MRRRAAIQVAVLLPFALSCGSVHAHLKAFPEAVGFGSAATGGRAGSIYHVTNLNNSGSGSFRDAVSQPNRIVVFDVSGYINIVSELHIASNTTILGQTAPGMGIGIIGREVSFGSSDNVICRYLRFRPGSDSVEDDNGVNFYQASNLILDHVSIEFAKWNNVDAVGGENITVQNSIIADPIGQQFGAHSEVGPFTWHSNLWASAHNRQPLAKADTQYVNNIVYNYQAAYTSANTVGYNNHDVVNNYFIVGPATTAYNNNWYQLTSRDSMYVSGNMLDTSKDGLLNGSPTVPGGVTVLTSPWSNTTPLMPALSAADAYEWVVTNAGASLARDDVDSLIVGEVQSLGTQGPYPLPNSQTITGLPNNGFGILPPETRPAGFDTDNDGVEDAWEAAHGMSSADPNDSLLFSPLGYTMVEQYANELALSTTATMVWSASSGSWNTPANWTTAVPTFHDLAAVQGAGIGTNGSVTIGGVTAYSLSLGIGGNGDPAGERVVVNNRGLLRTLDTVIIGQQNQGTLEINSGGNVTAANVQVGNTIGGTTYQGLIQFNGGVLRTSRIVFGGGGPGNWDTGGEIIWSGGRLIPFGGLEVNVPITLTGDGEVDTNGENATISAVIGGDGALIKSGDGTLTLQANNLYTGETTVAGGVLRVLGSLQSSQIRVQNGATLAGQGSTAGDVTVEPGGRLAPGTSPGLLAIGGNFDLAATGLLQIELATYNVSDRLDVAANASLAGTLEVALTSGFTLQEGDSFLILSVGGTLTGQFDGLAEGALVGTFNDTDLFITYASGDGNDVALITVLGVPGDYNGDGVVDAADYTVWRDHLGTATTLPNDPTPGSVDETDYAVWKSHFGQSAGSGVGSAATGSAAVAPEPSSFALLLAAAMCPIAAAQVVRSIWAARCRR